MGLYGAKTRDATARAVETVRRLGDLTQCKNAAPALLEEGICRGL